MAEPLIISGSLLPLERQRHKAREQWALVEGSERFHGALPVLLLNRCWLRLEVVAVAELAQRFPPDASAEAPELVHFRALRAEGLGMLAAEERCWDEFGRQACQEALLRYWRAQDRGHQGWTLERYLALLAAYRQTFEAPEGAAMPLIVLARPGPGECHHLHWLRQASTPMRHTCA
ncbi:hypothetical protein [Cyanobium sp. Morenito 9A2]|uniref:hypothetical protein n=1 Tax=Cyanobium sp. Morenito 9A2 TaxID=2823718 RepID=UPI0020CB87CE|nr:hypothetical protein [Cyanobium sp. Morenito 9A2]MCP9849401.1 hypothetical protein [Cyanobium sp. Morenito 9A2]